MEQKLTINSEALGASQQGALETELFLHENYLFRRNVLSGKVEYADKPAENASPAWKLLTTTALNSIVLRAKREQIIEKGSPKTDIMEFINSDEVLSIWMRSLVAHWLQMDKLHGNECVPTLIGAQGCGKTTFFVRLLPPHLRQYYLDHLNLSNKFDKEMALTNNLLVNLDELDAIRPSQHASLKQTLSKSKVNGRPIYGASQEDRPRYASFVATTNNPHPLTDATGSRRYICLTIPKGMFIDNTGEIDYEQLYAQVLYELREQHAPYWFNNDEVARIQELNQNYLETKDIVEMVSICFRKPNPGEQPKSMNCNRLLEVIANEFPTVKATHSTKVYLGRAMKTLGFESTDCGHVAHYKVIPLRAA